MSYCILFKSLQVQNCGVVVALAIAIDPCYCSTAYTGVKQFMNHLMHVSWKNPAKQRMTPTSSDYLSGSYSVPCYSSPDALLLAR
jgi:hypothetical protein